MNNNRDSLIKGKIVKGIQFNGYLSLNLLNIKSGSGIDTDSLCLYIINKIMNYKGVRIINKVDIISISNIGSFNIKVNDWNDGNIITINANLLTDGNYNINREYKIIFDLPSIKSELRDIKLKELEL